MYQILSFSKDKEYVITEDEWEAEMYNTHNIIENLEFYSRPLFQTLLDFLNTDYQKKATDEFIELLCSYSDNYKMKGMSDIINSQFGSEIKNKEARQSLFCNFLYSIFPHDKKKQPISKLKRHRTKGMTINRLFEQNGIEYIKNHLTYKEKNRKYIVELLQNYFSVLKSEPKLNDPFIFRLFVNEFIAMDPYKYKTFYSDDIRISTAFPLIMEFSNLHNMDIKTFAEIARSVSYNNMYNEYIIKTIDTAVGHDKNPFARDNGLSELNIVISDIYFILQQEWSINKCANCGKFFISQNRSDTKYCQNPAPLDITKTCQEYASTRGYYINRQTDELENLRTKVKGRLSKRAQRDIDFYQPYKIFRDYDKEWRALVKTDDNKRSEYFKWLQLVNEQTKTGGGAIPNPKDMR